MSSSSVNDSELYDADFEDLINSVFYAENYLGSKQRVWYMMEADAIYLYRAGKSVGFSDFTFAGLGLLTEQEKFLLLDVFNESADYISAHRNSKWHGVVTEDNVNLIRTILNNEQSFKKGLLGMLTLKSVLDGFISSEVLLTQVLDEQDFVGNEGVGIIGHLLPSFTNGFMGSSWSMYEDRLNYTRSHTKPTNLLLDSPNKSGLVENLIRALNFSLKGVRDGKIIWGDFLDATIDFKNIQTLCANANLDEAFSNKVLTAFEELASLIIRKSPDVLRVENMEKLSFLSMRLYATQVGFMLKEVKPFVITGLSKCQDSFKDNDYTFWVEKLLASDEDRDVLKRIDNELYDLRIEIDGTWAKFAFPYIISEYGSDAIYEFRDFCFSNKNDIKILLTDRAFMEDMLTVYRTGIVSEIGLEMALRVEFPKWFPDVD